MTRLILLALVLLGMSQLACTRSSARSEPSPEPHGPSTEELPPLAIMASAELAHQLLEQYQGPTDETVAVLSIYCDDPADAPMVRMVRELLTGDLLRARKFRMTEQSLYQELEQVLAEQRSRDKGAWQFDQDLLEKRFGPIEPTTNTDGTPSKRYQRLPRTLVVIGTLEATGTDRIIICRMSEVATGLMLSEARFPLPPIEPPQRLGDSSDPRNWEHLSRALQDGAEIDRWTVERHLGRQYSRKTVPRRPGREHREHWYYKAYEFGTTGEVVFDHNQRVVTIHPPKRAALLGG